LQLAFAGAEKPSRATVEESVHEPPIHHLPEERARYEFLMRLYQIARRDPDAVVHAGQIGGELKLSAVQTFAVVEFLADQGFVEYLGAGPRVRISARGIRYIELEAGSRRTIR
jgi:hypothetical protein